MAEIKETKKEEKVVKPIILKGTNNNDIFVLEFNRDTVKYAEGRGFTLDALNSMNMSAMEDIFCYAFRMHQPKMSKADTDKILYEKLCGMPEGMLERLVDLYVLPFETLVQTEESAKNATMTVEL